MLHFKSNSPSMLGRVTSASYLLIYWPCVITALGNGTCSHQNIRRATVVVIWIQLLRLLLRELPPPSVWETSKSLVKVSLVPRRESGMWVCALRLMTNGVHSGQSPHKWRRAWSFTLLPLNPCSCVCLKAEPLDCYIYTGILQHHCHKDTGCCLYCVKTKTWKV